MLISCCFLAAAQAAETPAQKGKRIVDEALRELGGDAFLHMEDKLESGHAYSFYKSELSGLAIAKIYTRYPSASATAVPGKLQVRERESFFDKPGRREEDAAILFLPEGAWELTYRGAVPLPDERFTNYADSTMRNFFYVLRCRLGERGMEFYWTGSDIVENRPVDIVDITDAADQKITVYFDQSTKLPVREVYKRRNPMFKDWDTEVSIFAKYRDVGGGVKWPFSVRRERNGEKIYEMYADSVEINQNLTDDLFNIPVSMKVLPKKK